MPNRAAVEMVLRTALALNCQISMAAGFQRKNYFYPDLRAFENQDCGTTRAGTTSPVNCEYRITYATGSDPLRPTAFSAGTRISGT